METARTKVQELRITCERDIISHQHKMDSVVASFANSLQSLRSKEQQSAHNQVEVMKLKAQLRQLQDELTKALAAKTRKEAKRMTIMDSLSETKVKVAEVQKIVQDQEERKDEFAATISQQSEAVLESKEKNKLAYRHIEEMQDAFSWYNRVLGFRIDGGHGVKFTFININKNYPTEEYSFTIQHSNDVYRLLGCDPQVNDIEEPVNELNRNNDLFKFVRIMRQKVGAGDATDVEAMFGADRLTE